MVGRERAFSPDASHQLRTSLTGMRGAIETEPASPRDDRFDGLTRILQEADRLERTAAGRQRNARCTPGHPARTRSSTRLQLRCTAACQAGGAPGLTSAGAASRCTLENR